MIKYFDDGDQIWHLRYGKGRVLSSSAGTVLVTFDKGGTKAFTKDDWALWPWPPWRRIRATAP
ncbi:conserved protein of unknown function [Kyrpidia spormannii]|uniref:Uncharacterized protein n=2 Tax=Kyrpidia spormannii TaxID=2055160 RepID=A0ACA8ZCU0_9BACL|nr:conserved protein of unknown function [Kyrpidia spormannii]CAB3396033.1 conserved protein of unknown function [Kyrpidia spormannii]